MARRGTVAKRGGTRLRTFRLSLFGVETCLVFATTTHTLLLLELCLSLLALLLSLKNLLGTFPFSLLSTLRSLDAFQFRVLPSKRTTFNITSTDAKGSPHLVHLCLLGSSQCMRIGWLKVADVDVRASLRLGQQSRTQCCDFGFNSILVDTKTEG